jgi:hypothetical protein
MNAARVPLVVLVLGSPLLCGCSRSAAASPGGSVLCTDVAGLRQLVADAAAGRLSQASEIERIQSLETSLSDEAMSLGAKGDPTAATAAANLTVALGTWKTDISLDQDSSADARRAQAAADRISGCRVATVG